MSKKIEPIITNMLNDATLTVEDKFAIKKFIPAADIRVKKLINITIDNKGTTLLSDQLKIENNIDNIKSNQIDSLYALMPNTAGDVGINLKALHKDGALMYALWICLLVVLKRYISVDELKYKNINDFYAEYKHKFENEDSTELDLLWQTANWMYVLFKMITARKNKGLAIQVIPKLIEGWEAKYVTGSGQKRSTANRVYLFESEGHTTASHRGKFRTVINPKKPVDSTSRSGNERVPFQKKRRSDEDSEESAAPQPKPSKRRTTATPAVESSLDNLKRTRGKTKAANNYVENTAGLTDQDDDDDNSNEDMKEAYALMRTNTNTFLAAANQTSSATDNSNLEYISSLLPLGRDDTIGLGFDLTRSYSLNSVIPDFQRGYSWTENALTEAIVEVSDSNNIGTGSSAINTGDSNILSNDNLNDLFSGYVAK